MESGEGAITRAARRRRPRKGDLKEQAILETAARLLSERPLDEIGINELARGAGISRPTFYFYFESKQAVLAALVERIADETYAASEWLSRTDQPPAEAIRASICASVRLWREHGPVLRAAVETWGSTPELRGWEQIIDGFVEATAAQIKRERRSGIAPNSGPSARALATALIWMNERCLYTASLGAIPSLGDRDLTNTLTTIWLRAVYGTDRP